MADPITSETASKEPDPKDADASFHVVPFPPEAKFATIGCYSTNGVIRLTKSTEGEPTSVVFSPDSPVYNLKNPACAGNIIVPLGTSSGKPIVVALSFCNDSSDDQGTICVVVALSFPPVDQQKRLLVKRPLKSRFGTIVHIVFSPA